MFLAKDLKALREFVTLGKKSTEWPAKSKKKKGRLHQEYQQGSP